MFLWAKTPAKLTLSLAIWVLLFPLYAYGGNVYGQDTKVLSVIEVALRVPVPRQSVPSDVQRVVTCPHSNHCGYEGHDTCCGSNERCCYPADPRMGNAWCAPANERCAGQ
jgi:hypothetical protein